MRTPHCLTFGVLATAGLLLLHASSRSGPAAESAGTIAAGAPAPPAGPAPEVAGPAVDAVPAPTVKTRIEPGVPVQYQAPYLQNRSPVVILADGTQIYDGIPYHVRQPDGTFRTVECRMTLQPTKARPVFPEDLAPAARKQ